MVFFNYGTKQLAAKIVYYGPGLSGKTTNLQVIYRKTHPRSRGELISLETGADRTLFFDLLPVEVGRIKNFNVRFQLYTVPGQVHYNETRKMVLKGVDGIIFVADSQETLLDSNIESMENLAENLASYNLKLEDLPLVIQYNKRDLPGILPVEVLQKNLNHLGVPYAEAIATRGVGVFETLKSISRLTLARITQKLEEQEKVREKPIEIKEKIKEFEEETTVVMPPRKKQKKAVERQDKKEVELKKAPVQVAPKTEEEKTAEEEIDVEFAVENERPATENVYFRKISVSRKEADKQLDQLVNTILGETKTTPRKVGKLERKEFHEVFKEVLRHEKTVKKDEQFDIPLNLLEESKYIMLNIKPEKGGKEFTLKIPVKGKGFDIVTLKLNLKLIGK